MNSKALQTYRKFAADSLMVDNPAHFMSFWVQPLGDSERRISQPDSNRLHMPRPGIKQTRTNQIGILRRFRSIPGLS